MNARNFFLTTILLLLVLLLLTGCAATQEPPAPVQPVTRIVTVEAPQITLPPVPVLRPVQLDVPRNADGSIVATTNIHLGLDLANWQNLQYNLTALNAWIVEAQARAQHK